MNTITQLWMPNVATAVFIFIASSLIHMVFKWHNSDYRKLANEDDVRAALRATSPGPGQYIVPHCADMKDMAAEAMQKKFIEGPIERLRLTILSACPLCMFPPGNRFARTIPLCWPPLRRGQVYPIASCSFRAIHRIIRRIDNAIPVACGSATTAARHAKADRDAGIAGDRQRRAFDNCAHALGDDRGLLLIAVGQNGEKLLAAPATQGVGVAHRGLQKVGDAANHLVAGIVTVAVIYRLDKIDVAQDHGERPSRTHNKL